MWLSTLVTLYNKFGQNSCMLVVSPPLETWQMLFNFGKCKCKIGVTFSADMKVSEQYGIAASKENQILGLIRRTIMYK